MNNAIKLIVATACLFVFFQILTHYRQMKKEPFSFKKTCALLFTGFISNISDTIGLGSFAVVVALNNRFRTFDDKIVPGTLNAQSVLPSMLQSILFLNFVEVDLYLLLLFVASACFGGFLSGYLVSKLDKKAIRQLMCAGFVGVVMLILSQKGGLLPNAGFATSLPPFKMAVGAVAMVFAGMLPAIGAGIYVPIQTILFLLGLSPLAAFPIMTTAGAIVQTATASAFVMRGEFAVKESLFLSFSGILGVAVAVPIISFVNLSSLHWLLLTIAAYNAFSLWKLINEENVKPARI
ncbi:putative membrane protein [Waddlia chondrophila 2032/99]|uniref:Probable membrane transporter protein n=2 Tax=Waddlia chondrophila TaxID=71667 RepID=D6YUR5_WADCW|nr:sulfite exporter TauE/SafE family protein [Waddlia chondrophila]ADI37876.1 putative membrane protein [Waddlia chondrophila WSU 86-1044]CCB91246.1 putative membrane protein [Waddlia chondrophila 2032/99]